MPRIHIHFKEILKYLTLAGILLSFDMFAQTYDGLDQLDGHKLQVYYSQGLGSSQRVNEIAIRCDSVYSFYESTINFNPTGVKLLILDPDDWTKFALTGAPYGVPHYKSDNTLVIASQNNGLWKSFLPPIDKLPQQLAEEISRIYVDKDGNPTMQPFFDLLAIHELGHAFHNQGELTMQRHWMTELFANIFLHTYIAKKEPILLPALTVFPQMVIAATDSEFQFTTLSDFEAKYDEIARRHPKNYGWYQSMLHSAAADIYNSGGGDVFAKLWRALEKHEDKLTDENLAVVLNTEVHQSVANVWLKWDDH